MKKLMFPLLIIVLALSVHAYQYTVCPLGCNFSDISAALDNITGTNSTIVINESGVYYVNASGAYQVDDSLSAGAVLLNASDVVLDCNGSSLTGAGQGTGIAVAGSNVTLQNCSLNNYTVGILVDSCLGCRISGCSVQQSSVGIRLDSSNQSTIEGTSIQNATSFAVDFFDSSADNYLYSCNISSSSTDIRASENLTSAYIVNSSFAKEKIIIPNPDTARVYVLWYFRAFVNDTSGNNVTATVNVTGAMGTVYSLAAAGYTAQKNLTEFMKNYSGTYNYNNYTFYAYNTTGFTQRSVNITATTDIVLTFDLTEPVIGSLANSTDNTTINISFSTDDLANSTVEWGVSQSNLSNSSYSPAFARQHLHTLGGLFANTTYYFNITCCNDQGYCQESGHNATTEANPELVPPVIAVLYPANASTLSNDTAWTFINISTNENATCHYSQNSSFSLPGTAFGYTGAKEHYANFSVSQNTTYGLYYKCNDSLGNINNASMHHSFSINATPDLQPPQITVVWPANGSYLSNDTTTANISVTTDEAAVCRYSTNSSAAFANQTNLTVTGQTAHTMPYPVSEGNAYNIYYWCNDTHGNINSAPAHHYFYVNATPPDTSGPVISSMLVHSITNSSAVVVWSTDEPATSRVKYGTSPGNYTQSSYSATLSTSHSRTLTGLSENTTYYFVVNSTDALGNPSESSEQTFKTVDTTAPVLSGVTAASITGTAATVTWTTNENANSMVLYGTASGSYPYKAVSATFTKSHSVQLAGLSENQLYYYKAMSNDTEGNSGQSSQYSFTTIDGTPPAITFTYPVNMSTTVSDIGDITLSVTTDETASCYVDSYKIGTSAVTTDTSMATSTGLSHTKTLAATAESSGYSFYFEVNCSDASNNSRNSIVYFSLDDTTVPSITFVSPTPASAGYTNETTADIKVSVSEALASGYPKISIDSAANATMSSSGSYYTYQKTGLAEGSHTLKVYALDNAGNSASASRTFTVDTTDPDIESVYPEDGDELKNCNALVVNITLSEEGNCSLEIFEYLEAEYGECIDECGEDQADCEEDADDSDEEEECDDEYDECKEDCEDDKYDSVYEKSDIEEVWGTEDCEDLCDEESEDCEDACDLAEDRCFDSASDADDRDECEEDADDCIADCDDDLEECNEDCLDAEFIYQEDYSDSCLDDAEYMMVYACSDLAGNQGRDNLTFTVKDTTPPKIVSKGPSGTLTTDSADIYATTDEDATCKFDTKSTTFAAMATSFFGTAKTHTYEYSGLGSGNHTFYVLCNDTRGNIMASAEKIQFAVSADAAPTKDSKSFTDIAAGGSAAFAVQKADISVTLVEVTVNADITDAQIEVTKLADASSLKKPAHPAYQFLRIEITGITNKQIDSAKIDFRVPMSWISQSNADADDIRLYKYTTDWTEESTSKVSEDSQYAYYEATTSGFSLFAVLAKKDGQTAVTKTDTKTKPQEKQAPEPSENQTKALLSDEPAPQQPEESSYLWIIILIVVVVGGGAAGLYVYKSHRHPQQDSFAGPLSQPTPAAADEGPSSEQSLSAAASPTDELGIYIVESRSAGMSPQAIKKSLLDAGHDEYSVDLRMEELGLVDPVGDYVRQALSSGRTPDEIKKDLIDAGHGPQDVVNKMSELGLFDSPEKELKAYVEGALGSGATPEQIRQQLLDAGNDAAAVNSVMEAYAREPAREQESEETDLTGYVQSGIDSGLDGYSIRQDLADQGFSEHAVDEAMGKAASMDRGSVAVEASDEILEYIKNAQRENVPKRVIVRALVNAGHSRKDIEKRFLEIKAVQKKLRKDIKEYAKIQKKKGRSKDEIISELLASGFDEDLVRKAL